MKGTRCAYCGRRVAKCDKEHVFPVCLYPRSKSNSRVQRLTIPACRDCNSGWADDEAHFRNVLALAGDPNAARRELWETGIRRSLDKVDGPRRVKDLIALMKPVMVANTERYMVFPGEDERVLHVVRKIVRGLCHYHGAVSPVSDQRVWADVLTYEIPQEFLEQMEHHHREQDIVQYHYQVVNEQGIHSAWLLTFFERVTFIGLVFTSENGLAT